MNINKNTKISDLIKKNPETIETIASVNKNFEKIRNPFLRKILASRITIEDAALIGGCSVNEIFEKLILLGFKPENLNEDQMNTDNSNINSDNPVSNVPVSNVPVSKIHTLDVRPIFKTGKDPFHEIMDALKKVPGDGLFCLINGFEPIPLINVLKSKGYSNFVEKIATNEVHTWFWKDLANTKYLNDTDLIKSNNNLMNSLVQKFEHNLINIDVSHLEMPQPMLTILEELEKLPLNHALFVNHKKVPLFLLPELKERGYEWCYEEVEPNKVNVIIYKR